MHIYAFGSICRGDVSLSSDVDLLALVEQFEPRFDQESYSTYSYQRIEDLWRMGNPFAWHLSIESKLIYSSDSRDFLSSLGHPERYSNWPNDSEKFIELFQDAANSAATSSTSRVFDLATVFLSIRNLATCYSLLEGRKPNFSRNSALCLGDESIQISGTAYRILERARILCTRGYGRPIAHLEIIETVACFDEIHEWMKYLVERSAENA